MTDKQLLELTKKYPNNLELGDAIRKIAWDIENKANEVYVNPNQITLNDMINEVENNKNNGTRL